MPTEFTTKAMDGALTPQFMQLVMYSRLTVIDQCTFRATVHQNRSR